MEFKASHHVTPWVRLDGLLQKRSQHIDEGSTISLFRLHDNTRSPWLYGGAKGENGSTSLAP